MSGSKKMPDPSMIFRLFRVLLEDAIRNISGSLGIRLRRYYYQKRLASCGDEVTIETGVYFINPHSIYLGHEVWIDKNVILIAGLPTSFHQTRVVPSGPLPEFLGKIQIGSKSHIGISSIIQGHGGVMIGNYFTSSAQVAIYSMSNDPKKCVEGTMPGPHTHYIISPVEIGENVWLGLGVKIIGHRIGDNTFIKPNAVVTKEIPANCIAEGMPAIAISPRF